MLATPGQPGSKLPYQEFQIYLPPDDREDAGASAALCSALLAPAASIAACSRPLPVVCALARVPPLPAGGPSSQAPSRDPPTDDTARVLLPASAPLFVRALLSPGSSSSSSSACLADAAEW